MKTFSASIYDHPKYYDTLYFANSALEVNFLVACFERYASGSVRRLFEPACGTGRLLWRVAKLGYDIHGIDLNPQAVAYCNKRLRSHGFPETAIVADMTTYRHKPLADAAFNTISSFCHLTTDEQAASHLNSVADSLKKSGLYILAFHLVPTCKPECDHDSWSAQRGSLRLFANLSTTNRNLKTRIDDIEFNVTVRTPNKQFELHDSFPMRNYTLQNFTSLLETTNRFQIEETFTFQFDINEPTRLDEQSEDVVFVLRKK
ncbi:MAG: class I SAM-dependent methyltransferase [Planctomycetaceae bacterium]|jgi:SAM-dependent methyltransferase|nr:class I SAM-dependent methyltransferase [Planctomycetaceae bacterium]